MATIFVRLAVADYEKWKRVFDEHEGARRNFGFTSHTLHRDVDEPGNVVVMLVTDDLARAREFLSSESLRAALQRGGVVGAPEIRVTEDVEEIAYAERAAHPLAERGEEPSPRH